MAGKRRGKRPFVMKSFTPARSASTADSSSMVPETMMNGVSGLSSRRMR